MIKYTLVKAIMGWQLVNQQKFAVSNSKPFHLKQRHRRFFLYRKFVPTFIKFACCFVVVSENGFGAWVLHRLKQIRLSGCLYFSILIYYLQKVFRCQVVQRLRFQCFVFFFGGSGE